MSRELVTSLTPEGLSQPHFDAIIVHGKNWRKYPPGSVERLKARFLRRELPPFSLRLSMESKFTALAAGMLYTQGYTNRLIFSTGRTAGSEYPSEAEAMAQYMKIRFPKIPEEAISLEDASYDTAGNVRECRKIIQDDDFKNAGYLTVSYHFPRVFMLLNNYDVDIQVGFASDQIVRSRSRMHDQVISRYIQSDRYKKEKRKESILIAELLVDPKAVMLDYVTRKVRHQ